MQRPFCTLNQLFWGFSQLLNGCICVISTHSYQVPWNIRISHKTCLFWLQANNVVYSMTLTKMDLGDNEFPLWLMKCNAVYPIFKSVLSFSLRTRQRGTVSQSTGSRWDRSCLALSASLFLICVRGGTKFFISLIFRARDLFYNHQYAIHYYNESCEFLYCYA